MEAITHQSKISMENGTKKWRFQAMRNQQQQQQEEAALTTANIRGVLGILMGNLDPEDKRPVVPLSHGDPSAFPCFRTSPAAEDAIVDALKSAKHNHYSPSVGILPARRALADYMNKDLPYKLSPDNVYLTAGCSHAIELALTVLAQPGNNILLPRPGFPYTEAIAASCGFEVRHFDLLPEQGWEVDLEAVEALGDENTVAMVIINPGNPCGNVYSYEHLKKVAETARKLGIIVIADEVYGHMAFGSTPFVPMGVFGSVVPVLTLGSLSKRWIVPGWRMGWLVTNDPTDLLRDSGVVESIKNHLNTPLDPVTFIQAALPRILENTTQDFFSDILNTLRDAADLSYRKIQDIPCITCPQKAEGSMFMLIELNLSDMEDINDDIDFSLKLAREESTFVLPGTTVGMKNWFRISFAVDPATLEDGLERMKAFCLRHAKKQTILN
ncbi:hypothetical protein Tsubulata_030235 [Turnera subulata]|uniref:Aminotransferase class I/classII large domain-containing protein n=1 Tax=Turnera subulata TaxID=218843 RepID=A0A9Q0JCT1_9ROSI|nr:hypothetical protein Tsubulata_030235 [Turnera subulata]